MVALLITPGPLNQAKPASSFLLNTAWMRLAFLLTTSLAGEFNPFYLPHFHILPTTPTSPSNGGNRVALVLLLPLGLSPTRLDMGVILLVLVAGFKFVSRAIPSPLSVSSLPTGLVKTGTLSIQFGTSMSDTTSLPITLLPLTPVSCLMMISFLLSPPFLRPVIN